MRLGIDFRGLGTDGKLAPDEARRQRPRTEKVRPRVETPKCGSPRRQCLWFFGRTIKMGQPTLRIRLSATEPSKNLSNPT